MEDVQALADRLSSALDRLEGRLVQGPDAGEGDAERVASLEAENQGLRDRLDALTAERERDLAQLDELIARLRPLIEEAV